MVPDQPAPDTFDVTPDAAPDAAPDVTPDAAVTVVVATRDRRASLLHTLDRLAALPERPPVIVVDNASQDGSSAAARAAHPTMTVLELDRNLGAVARNIGVAKAATPYVAFADDDSWWAEGALDAAVERLERCDRLAVVQGRILVGEDGRLDDACAAMAHSPLAPCQCGAGPSLLGFIACGAVVRRLAFLEVGGFDDTLQFLGEEALVAWDLAAAGRHLAYVDTAVAHHHPHRTADRAPTTRTRRQRRNALLTTWMRRPMARVVSHTASEVRRDPRAVLDAGRHLPAAWRKRRPVPPALEADLRRLERAGR